MKVIQNYIVIICSLIKMLKIIKFGFRPITCDIERGQNFKKGSLLLKADYVKDVEEHENNGEKQTTITAKVQAQTRVTVKYSVKLILSENRTLETACCNCKAGNSGCCKHICAVILYINSDQSAASKTSFSQQWGQPSAKQLSQYEKGVRISSLYEVPTLSKKAAQMKPIPLCSSLLEILSYTPLYTHVKFEELHNEEVVAVETLLNMQHMMKKQELLSEASNVVREILSLQSSCVVYSAVNYNIEPEVWEFLKKNVDCDMVQAYNISMATINQSADKNWFKERRLRITASMSHRIKAKHRDVEKVVNDLLSLKKIETPAMVYGKKTEETAFRQYEKDHLDARSHISKVGLIIKYSQPWLACSPDGIISYGQNISDKKLLEIKCPSTCKDKPIYNENTHRCNVPYLDLDENGIHLNKKNQIYTQVQIQMYVTNIPDCDLYVFSKYGSVLVKVAKDDNFLKEVIVKLEEFYFNHYLPKLAEVVI